MYHLVIIVFVISNCINHVFFTLIYLKAFNYILLLLNDVHVGFEFMCYFNFVHDLLQNFRERLQRVNFNHEIINLLI